MKFGIEPTTDGMEQDELGRSEKRRNGVEGET